MVLEVISELVVNEDGRFNFAIELSKLQITFIVILRRLDGMYFALAIFIVASGPIEYGLTVKENKDPNGEEDYTENAKCHGRVGESGPELPLWKSLLLELTGPQLLNLLSDSYLLLCRNVHNFY